MLDLCNNEAICLQANEMLDRTMVNSASIWPACSCFSNHVVRFSISYLFFLLIGVGVAAGLVGPAPVPATA